MEANKSSTNADNEIKKTEDKQYEMEFRAELAESMKRKSTYKNNMYSAYALLWERCAKAMQSKIASRSDCDSTVFNDPIASLQAIKEDSLNYQETRYEISIIADSF
jgi:hypothetical protein